MPTIETPHDILHLPTVLGVVQGNHEECLQTHGGNPGLSPQDIPTFLLCAQRLGAALGLTHLQQAQLHTRGLNFIAVQQGDEWIGGVSDSRAHLVELSNALHQFMTGRAIHEPEKVA
jgi:hypothetical protein